MDNKAIFAKNLQKYMSINNKSRREVSEDLKISYHTFTDWYKGKKFPRMNSVQMLADYFGISVSDLIEEKTAPATKAADGTILGDIVKSLRINSHLSLAEFSTELGIPLEDLQKYESGLLPFSADTIRAVADFYGYTPEDITAMLFHTIPDNKQEIRLSPTYLAYVKKWNVEFGGKIIEEDYEKLFDYARYLIWQRENNA